MMRKLGKICGEHPFAVIGIIALITLIMATGIPKVKYETDFETFLPEGYPSLEALKEIENKFGQISYEQILIKSGDLTEADAIKILLGLENEILSDPELDNYVEGVQSYLTPLRPYLFRDGELLPDNELENLVRGYLENDDGVVSGRYITADRKFCLITVSVNSANSKDARKKTEYFEELVENYTGGTCLDATVTGAYSTEKDLQQMMDSDNIRLISAALILILVVLGVSFRRVSDVVLPLLVIGVSTVWMVGVMGHLHLLFSTVAIAILPLQAGICITYAIHMVNRYREERAKNTDVIQAVVSSEENTGMAVFLTALTTTIGFGSWLISDMPPLRDFGFICMLGIMFSFVTVVTLLPALLATRDRGKKLKATQINKKKVSAFDRGLAKMAVTTVNHSKAVIVIGVVLTVVAIGFATQTQTAIQYKQLMPKGVKSIEASEEITEYFGGQEASAIQVLVKGDIRDPEVLNQMLELSGEVFSDDRIFSDDRRYITGVLSVAHLVALQNSGVIPDTPEGIEPILENLENQMPELTRLLIPPERDETIMMFFTDLSSDAEMALATDIVREHIRGLDNQADFMPTGTPVVAADLLEKIPGQALQTTVLSFILCAAVMCAIFRNMKIGLLSMVPICVALAWQFGSFYVLGIPFNLITVLISALLVGIGIDFSIHTAHRYVEGLKKRGLEPKVAVHQMIVSVGRALIAAAATTCGAFAILLISKIPAIGIFGGMTALVIFYCMLAALMLLPSLLVMYVKRK